MGRRCERSNRMFNACMVMILDRYIRVHLSENDPKALLQVCEAVEAEGKLSKDERIVVEDLIKNMKSKVNWS